MQHGPSNAGLFVSCLQGMTHHRFPVPFAPYIRRGCYQEQEQAVFVDDCRCGRHWLIAFVSDKSIRSAPSLLEAWLTTTDAPSAASPFAIPAPIPFDAPVTSATLFVSFPIFRSVKQMSHRSLAGLMIKRRRRGIYRESVLLLNSC